MSTPFPKTGKVVRKWYLVDLEGKILGRAASRVAAILKGKTNPMYTPHLDTGDHVVAINAAKIRVTGKKLEQKMDYRHSGWPGGDRYTPYGRLLAEHPERVFELAVKGMLPKNSIGRAMFRKLIVYRGAEHEQQAQKPEKMEI
jgi:large subunit ribosomal protein L13